MIAAIAPEEHSWQDLGSCGSSDPDSFFPEAGTSPSPAAVKICDSCPVQEDCLVEAILNGEVDGLWGGMTFAERKKEARRRNLQIGSGRARVGKRR